MKIVHVLYFFDESFTCEEEVLQQYYTITGWAEALQRTGAEVTVIYRYSKESSFKKNNVEYYFIKDSLEGTLRSWHMPVKFLRKISSLDADIIHLHNFSLCLQTFFLRMLLKKKTAIIIQHHGGKLPGKRKRFYYNLFNSVADGFFFTTIEQGKEWFMKKKSFRKIMPVMEGGTFFNYTMRDVARTFNYSDRNIARQKTAMTGSPVFLWVGRLDSNKDPLTVLEGFKILAEKYPGSNLYMIYSDDKLSNEVEKKIEATETLKNKVHLVGKIVHEEIEQYYNSADYFVLGSHYEGSGYALSEALSCGCVPIITDIPSFRMMTNDGLLGALWQPGNKDSFVKAVVSAISKSVENEGSACIDFFRKTLSFDAIARAAAQHYQDVIEDRIRNTR